MLKNHSLHIRFKNLTEADLRLTIPTFFTAIRLFLIPFIIGSMVYHYWGQAFSLFLVASVSDVIDGFLARLLNEKTFLGACLDAITDKLLLISCFTALAFIESPLFTIPLWFVLLVLLKESILILGALYIFYKKGSLKVEPTMLGKLTTFIQILFIIWLFTCYFFNWLPLKTYHTMLGLLMIVVFASLGQYTRIGWRYYLKS